LYLKQVLARGVLTDRPAVGVTLLIYHRVGGGSADERDVTVEAFRAQLDALAVHEVVSLDEAIDRLERDDRRPCFVLTFDDGFRDLYENGWPLLHERHLPFTVYIASKFVGGTMHWDGSTAKMAGPALTWEQVGTMVESGLCTLGNHTHAHVRPEHLTCEELDHCTEVMVDRIGVRPRHFAYPWGVPVPSLTADIQARFRTAATGRLGRNLPGADPLQLRRVPVRRTDPLSFFRAKLTGGLGPERTYDTIVRGAKKARVRA